MTKKSVDTSRENAQIFSRKKLISISIIIVLAIALASALYFIFSQRSEVPFSLNAAIIDQLGKDPRFANPYFVGNATNILETAGFNVTYHNETLDVDFFRGLAKSNYGIIILRVHSAQREDNSTVDLFTAEEFSDSNHRWELENGFVTKGEYLYEPGKYFFAITSRFVENLEGYFPKSIIIAMGCWSLKPDLKPEPDKLAKAFIDKGAKAYVGWTDLVLPQDTDTETLKLLRMLLNENKTFAEARAKTQSYQYYDVQTNTIILSRMNFYPDSASNLKISDLISETKTTSTLIALNGFKVGTCFLNISARLRATRSNRKNSRKHF